MINYIIEHKAIKKGKFLTDLRKFIEKILRDYSKEEYAVSILLTSDEVIRKYNKTYRGKDESTDVLSFCFMEDNEFHLPEEIKELGDIIISVDTMGRQAREFETSEEEELARLSIHGILHLLGFDHERSKEDEKIMFELQDKYLDEFLKERQ